MARNNRQPRKNNHPNSVKLLQRLENGLDAFMDASVDAFLLFDDNLDLMSINPAGERLFGVSKEMVVGKNIVELEPDIKETGKYDKYLDVMKTGELFFVEEPFSHPKFGDMHLSIKAFKMRKGLGMIVNDITERRQMEEALRESELLATATIEGMPDGVMLVSMDGRVAYVNEAFERLLGYKASELAGTSAVDLPTYRESKDKKKARQALKMVIEKGSAEPIDMIALSKDGMEIPINFTASVVKDAKGNPKTLVAVIRDVTERRWAEEELRRSEEYFKSLVENALDVITVIGSDGRIRYETPSIECVLGYEVNERIGRDITDFVHPDDMSIALNAFNTLTQEPSSIQKAEVRLRHKDGSWRIAEVIAKALLGSLDGGGFVLNWRDITERKQVEEALRHSEEYFRTLMENSSDAVTIINEDGTVRYESPSYERLLGFKPEERVGSSLYERIHTDDISRVAELFAQFLQNRGGTLHTEVRTQHKDGSWRSIEAIGSNLLDNPIVKGIVVNLRDITERKKAEEALRHSEEYFKALTENSSDAIAVLNSDGTTRYESLSIGRMLGYKPEDLVGRNVFELVHPDDIQSAAEAFEKLLQSPDATIETEVRYKHKDGSWSHIEGAGKNLLNNPAIAGIVVNYRDITERKRAEEALQQSELNYRVLFDSTLDGLFVVDSETMKVVLANESGMRMAKIYGFDSLTDLNIADMVEFFHPEDRDRVIKTIAEDMFEKDLRQINEFRMLAKDGREMWISAVGTRAEYQGKLAGLVSMRDITVRKRMEEELHRLSDAVRMSTDSIVVTDMGGNILDGNEASVRMYGADKREDLIGMKAFDIIAPEDREKAFVKMKEAMEKGYVSGLEYHIQTRDGRKILVEASTSLMRGSKGEPLGFVGVSRDITERKRAEESIRRNYEIQTVLNDLLRTSLTGVSLEEQLQLFLEHIVSIDSFGLKAKGSVFLVEGDPGVLVLKAQKGLAEPLLAMCARVPFGRCLCGRAALSGEAQFADCLDERHENQYEGITQHGHYCVPILYAGKVLGVINLYVGEGHTRDEMEEGFLRAVSDVIAGIIERKRMEEALGLSEERYRLVVENANEAIVVAQDGMLKFFNSRALGILGYSKEEMASQPFIELIHPDDQQMVAGRYMARLRGEELPSIYSFRVVDRAGNVRWAEISTVVINWEGRPATLNFLTDITERKRAEEEKQKMEEQLRLAGRLAAVGELSAGVAHELNNPIAAIQGFAQLLTAKNDLDETTKKDLGIIYREAQRAAKITQNLLSFARRHEPEKHLISLNEVIEKTLELRAYQMKVNNIEVVVEFATDLPKTMVDFFQMQQVFVNIINNAEQAMLEAHGRGRLVVKTQKAGNMIQATFADNGPGISEDNLKRIFDPFFTTKEVGKGTGLGLSICYGLVEAHGGRIYARSKLGEGATFVVEIPIVSEGQ